MSLLFADDFNQYEQDRTEAVEDLKDRDHHGNIMTKAAKKFSDMVSSYFLDDCVSNTCTGCKY